MEGGKTPVLLPWEGLSVWSNQRLLLLWPEKERQTNVILLLNPPQSEYYIFIFKQDLRSIAKRMSDSVTNRQTN